eukprot:m.532384 g.532384  ORF g.532384 m.532384 type:complete len:339 (-) comp22044_c0_seq1:2156-3172(-)
MSRNLEDTACATCVATDVVHRRFSEVLSRLLARLNQSNWHEKSTCHGKECPCFNLMVLAVQLLGQDRDRQTEIFALLRKVYGDVFTVSSPLYILALVVAVLSTGDIHLHRDRKEVKNTEEFGMRVLQGLQNRTDARDLIFVDLFVSTFVMRFLVPLKNFACIEDVIETAKKYMSDSCLTKISTHRTQATSKFPYCLPSVPSTDGDTDPLKSPSNAIDLISCNSARHQLSPTDSAPSGIDFGLRHFGKWLDFMSSFLMLKNDDHAHRKVIIGFASSFVLAVLLRYMTKGPPLIAPLRGKAHLEKFLPNRAQNTKVKDSFIVGVWKELLWALRKSIGEIV